MCIHGSEQPIPLSAAINSDNMRSLISQNLDDAEESPWLRQGLLALLIDVSEAELKVPNAKTNKKSEKNEKAATDESKEQRMEIEDEENGLANLSNEGWFLNHRQKISQKCDTKTKTYNLSSLENRTSNVSFLT